VFTQVDIEGADDLCIKSFLPNGDPTKQELLPEYASTEDTGLVTTFTELGFTSFKMASSGAQSPIGWQSHSKYSGGLANESVGLGSDEWTTEADLRKSPFFNQGNDLLAKRLPVSVGHATYQQSPDA
jgi:hypothetical protein